MNMKKNITLLILLIANLCFAQKQLDAIQGTASGTNSYSVTINSITEQSIYNGQKILVKFTNGNTTASTLKVTVAGGTSYPVKDIETKSGTGISNGDITAGCQLLLSYNSTFDSWQIIGGTSGGASQWTITGSDIYYNTGNVGINNSSPDAKLDVVSTSTVNPVASFSVNTSGSTNATGVNINAEGGTTTDALVVNSKSNVSGGINNSIVALATTANGGYNNALTSIAQNGDYNYGGKIAAQGGVDAVGLSISASGASGNNNAIDITAGNFKYTPGTEGSGKVLTSDANGVASWQTPSGGGGGVTTAVAPLSITTNTISIQTPTSGTVLRANGTAWTNSTYSVSNTFTANSILHATSTNTVGENTSFGFNGNQMYMGTTTPSTDHGVDFRWNNNAATYWRFYNPSTGTSSRNILRLYNQSYVLDFGINGINYTNSGLLRASTPFILFNAPTNENGLIYTSSTNGLIFAIGGTSSSNAKMYLDGTNGFVGIGTGTVAATAPLHVTGSTRALQISSTATTVATRPLMVINSAGDTILQLNSRGMFQTGNLEENLYFGTFQGQKTTTGTYNTGIGKYCFSFLTTGSYNTAGGHGSLYKMTTGGRNSAYGFNTLYNDTSGSYNVAVGGESQNQNLSGNNNTSVGFTSAFTNKTGNSNTSIGYSSLFENKGSGNIGIGYNAGYYGTWNNKGFIDNQDRTDSATQLRKSFMVMDFGADSSVQQLRLNGRIQITGGNYGNGKVLTSDANGLASWTTPSSGSVTSVDISGGTTGLTFSGGPITTAGTFTTSGTLSIANGGTGQTTANAAFNALSPNTTRGDITVMNATVNARLALGSAGKILRSDGTDLAYSTATYPNTTTANQILYSSATNTIGGSANLTYDGTTFSTPVASHSTSLTSPLIIGGSGTTQSLTYKTTTGVGTTGADHIFVSGNNGATEIARMTNAGEFFVGKTSPTYSGEIAGFRKNHTGQTTCVIENTNASGVLNYKVVGNQKTVELGLYNSARSGYGMIASNDVYMYGNTNFAFMAEGASAVIKWSTGSSTLEKMRLDASGRLGIGTTSPASKLDVEGGAAIGATYSGTTAAPTNGLIVEGLVGMGVSSPTAVLHLKAGSTSANTAPLKFTSGTNMTTPEDGAVEYNGTDYFVTTGSTRYTLMKALNGSATLDFPSTSPNTYSDLTITVTGASTGDVVSLGAGASPGVANTSFFAWVSASNTVTVRFNNADASLTADPGSATFKVSVFK